MTSLPPAAPGGRPAGRPPVLIGSLRGFLTACLPYSGKVHSRGNRTAPAASSLSEGGSEGDILLLPSGFGRENEIWRSVESQRPAPRGARSRAHGGAPIPRV